MKSKPKRQHYVPQVYLKYWCFDEKKKRLHCYNNFRYEKLDISIRDIFVKKNQYTLDNEKNGFVISRYPELLKEMAEKILEILKLNNYSGKYNELKLDDGQKIMDNYLFISKWKFYNVYGAEITLDENKELVNKINELSIYVIEHKLSKEHENYWNKRLKSLMCIFEKNINKKIVLLDENIDALLNMFLLTILRNPHFNYFGTLDKVLNILWDILSNNLEGSGLNKQDFLDQQKFGYRVCSVYESLCINDVNNGIYDVLFKVLKEFFIITITKANEGEGEFLTSDYPAFFNKTQYPESCEFKVFMFPLTPKYTLIMNKKNNSQESINEIKIFGINNSQIKIINRCIRKNSKERYVSLHDNLVYII